MEMMMALRIPTDRHVRARIVNAAQWLVAHHLQCTYSEAGNRFNSLHRPYEVPFVSDCSAGVTDLYCWGDAPDPNKRGYDAEGYTGTLMSAGKRIAPRSVRECDVAIFGPYPGWHAVMAISGGADPLVWSMGEQGDPRLYPCSTVAQAVAYVHNVATCPVSWYRYATNAVTAT
jgi:hypothetical protein